MDATIVGHIVIAGISGVSAVLCAVISSRVKVIHRAVNGRYDALSRRVSALEHQRDGAD